MIPAIGVPVAIAVAVLVPLQANAAVDLPDKSVEELVRSRALVIVPDMAAYRRDWERSMVRLKFGDGAGGTTVAEIPAPAPGGR